MTLLERDDVGLVLPLPATGTIDLWRIDLTIDADAEAAMSAALDAGELARADRFATAMLRARFVAARASVRAILAGYLGLTPAKVSFVRGAHGKPAVPGGVPAFNVSHSSACAVCAVAAVGRVGVDVERIRTVQDVDRLAEMFFSRREAGEIRRLPAEARERAFLNTWTRKEALVKATGEGLSRPLTSFEVTSEPRDLAPVGLESSEETAQHWWLRSVYPRGGYLGAVAHDRPIAAVTGRTWAIRSEQATVSFPACGQQGDVLCSGSPTSDQ